MSIRRRADVPRAEGTPKLIGVAGARSEPPKIRTLRTPRGRTSWIRIAFIAACAATLLIWLYWTRQFASPEPHKRNDNDPAFIVRDLPGRGKGMVAIRDIRRGELLIRERPLILVPHKTTTSPSQLILDSVQQLSPDQVASFYNLSHVNLPENLSLEETSKQLPLAIFQTNAVAAGSNVGLFPTIARLNHGCSGAFNSVYSWREREGVLIVHALKDIKSGEELLTTYSGTRQTRDERRRFLKQSYGFHCMCTYCTLPDEESKASDIRLTTISDLYKRLSSWGHGTIDGQEAIQIVKQIWAVGGEEGYTSERGRLAADAMIVAAAHSDAEAAMEWATLALEWASYELGSDSDLAEEMRKARQEPKRHMMWGRSSVMRVGGPSVMMYGIDHQRAVHL